MEPVEPIDDVIVEEQTQEVESNEEPTTDSVTIEGEEGTQQEVVETQPEDRDDYWKNRSYELERKLGNLTDEIPKMVEETIIKTSKKETEKKEYTIAELEAYALDNPEHRPWVEEQKEELRDKKFEAKLKAKEQEQQQQLQKQQSELKVLNDSRYSDAFMDQGGQKLLNPNSPLAHKISSYLNDSRIKGQVNALEIASKLAYADLIDTNTRAKDSKLTDLKRKNTKLKQATLVEGGGVHNPIPTKTGYDSAMDKLRVTGTRKDAEAAVKEYYARLKK